MKKTFIVIAVILLGAGALAYPSVSDYLSRKNGSEIEQAYSNKISELDDETKNKLMEEAENYNEMLSNRIRYDFAADGNDIGAEIPAPYELQYEQMLNTGGIMGYVDIPKINVYLPIYHGTSDEVLNKGAGHLEGSALPIGGTFRHSVITGHSGLVHAKMFTDLSELTEGDLLYIHVLGDILAYEAISILVIEPYITDELAPIDGKDYCTLLTCTPYGVNTHRLLVRGERVEYIPEVKAAILQISESGADNPVTRAAIITTSVMLMLITLTILVTVKRKRQRLRFRLRLRARYVVAGVLAFVGVFLLLYPKIDSLLYRYRIMFEKDAFIYKIYATKMSDNNHGGGVSGIGGGSHGNGGDGSNGGVEGGGGGDGVGDQGGRGNFIYGEGDDYIKPLADSYEELYKFLCSENERLFETGQDDLKDAFSYQTAGIDLSRFGIDDGCIGYIEIPSINVLMPIYLGANTQNMKKGAAHMTQTSYPIGGNNTNAVIAAHRGGTLEMLRNIHKIKIGDEIIVINFRERIKYQAVEIKIILPTDIGEIKIQEGQDLVTLLTCNPLGENYQRYALYCKRVRD